VFNIINLARSFISFRYSSLSTLIIFISWNYINLLTHIIYKLILIYYIPKYNFIFWRKHDLGLEKLTTKVIWKYFLIIVIKMISKKVIQTRTRDNNNKKSKNQQNSCTMVHKIHFSSQVLHETWIGLFSASNFHCILKSCYKMHEPDSLYNKKVCFQLTIRSWIILHIFYHETQDKSRYGHRKCLDIQTGAQNYGS
jgi:hypothetical protein